MSQDFDVTPPDEKYQPWLSPYEMAEKAEANGCTLISGDNHTLLLDFDGAGRERYNQMFQLVDEWYGIQGISQWQSKSKKPDHMHLVVHLKTPIKSAAVRVALQAALGSDPKREMLSAREIEAGRTKASYLFKPKDV